MPASALARGTGRAPRKAHAFDTGLAMTISGIELGCKRRMPGGTRVARARAACTGTMQDAQIGNVALGFVSTVAPLAGRVQVTRTSVTGHRAASAPGVGD